jgi:potassium-transporting ATPase KdpC subunit
MKMYILPAVRLLLVLTLITGLAYPLVMTLFAVVACNDQANGSIITHNGIKIGSSLIGQDFPDPKYFHSRPSAIGYNPLPSSGSNFGPTSKAWQDSTLKYKTQFTADNGVHNTTAIPKEMISMSGSGLDPHISPEAAVMQVYRIAHARGFTLERTTALALLVDRMTEGPEFGFLGEPRINVLLLNCALDGMGRN